MWSEDIFNSSKTIFHWWGEYIKEVSDESGTEKALQLLLKPWERGGIAFAERMKQSDEINLNDMANQSVNTFIKLGYDRSAEVKPNAIIYTTQKCPLYYGFLEAGLSHETIEAWCISVSNAYDEKLKELLHRSAGYKIKFRTSADDVCVEEVILKP